MTEKLSFKPKNVAASLLAGLTDRAKNVIKKRFGLDSKETMTLEAVGQIYGITRERVRQIEDATLKQTKKQPSFALAGPHFDELKRAMEEFGGVVHEQQFLDHLTDDVVSQNNIHFLLVIGDAFVKLKESDTFHHRWTVDEKRAKAVHETLENLCERLDENELLPEDKIVGEFLNVLHDDLNAEEAKTHAKRWLKISKDIGQSPIGEWGLSKSPNVRVRGIRDYAYLIMRRHGKPMHFTEVAKAISETFGRKANPATSHNELIKDKRFVLVGRGMYALAEWGYQPGVVRDVIQKIIEKNGPMTKEQVMLEVKKERYVKDNTILVNLKNPKYFKESKEGKFSVA